MADTASVQTTESDKAAAAATSGSTKSGSSTTVDPGATPDLNLPSLPALTGAPVDLWDSGWPHGRFYWTVVPVNATLASTKSTILMGGGAQVSSTITVASISGISKGSTLTIGTGSTS